MPQPFNKEEIIKKIKAGKNLTKEEELFYLATILNFTEEEAEQIIAIGENNDPNLIID